MVDASSVGLTRRVRSAWPVIAFGLPLVALCLFCTRAALGKDQLPFPDPAVLPQVSYFPAPAVPPPDGPRLPPRPPLGPSQVAVVAEDKDSTLRFQWVDQSSYEQGYELYRALSHTGPWTLVGNMGPRTGLIEYAEYGLARDTHYWFKLRTYNEFGESNAVRVFSTLDGRGGIWRAQLRVRTADVANAGTNDSVHVALSDSNGTWIDHGGDDFERGDDDVYDLLVGNIRELSGIDHLYLFTDGDDGWCIEGLSLWVNEVEVYKQDFGSTASTCRWVEGGSRGSEFLYVGESNLRAAAGWVNYQAPPPPSLILREDVESLVEGLVGDALHNDVSIDAFPIPDPDPAWGGLDGERYVEVTPLADDRVLVTLDLEVDTLGGSAEVDVDFELVFTGSCTDGDTPLTLSISAENADAESDFDWATEFFSAWSANLLEDDISTAVSNSFSGLSHSIQADAFGEPLCIVPVVDADGNVTLMTAPARSTAPRLPVPVRSSVARP